MIYDEWGGFFDHVRPPRVPDDRASTDLDEDFGQMGFRIPAVAVSPVRAPRQEALALGARPRRLGRPHGTSTSTTALYGHESILKFISYRFGLGDLNKRMKFASNIGRSFEWQRPDFERPELPDPPRDRHPAVRARRRRRARQPGGPRERPGATSSGVAERYKLPVYEGKTERHLHASPTRSRRARHAPRLAGRVAPPMETRLLIRGEQVAGEGAPLAVENPATEETRRRARLGLARAAGRRDRRRARGGARLGGHARPSSAPSCCTRWPRACAR